MKLLKLLFVSALSILSFGSVSSHLSATESDFQNFVVKYSKDYHSSNEYVKRLQVFQENIAFINKHNLQGHSYTLDINEFADLTHAEFIRTRVSPIPFPKNIHSISQSISNTSLPTSLDWRTTSNPKGLVAVTAVKNQEQCGSCWSFSASGATEGAWAISGKPLTSLSEQQLIDCSSSYGNNGCNGGDMDAAFQYIIKNGLCTEASYPYQAADGTCKSCTAVGHLNGYTDIPDETGILTEIQKGPVSIGIEADQAVFQFYSGGVLDDSSCGTNLDHGVLIVGYGSLNGKDYWIVKNSWGSGWGMNGYVLIARGKGMCGIGQMQSRPYYLNKVEDYDFCSPLSEQQCTQNFSRCNWLGPFGGCANRNRLGFDWSLLWDCVDHCGGSVIRDIIQCAGDLTHIWDILKCVGDIVGTVSPCYKCIKGILG